MTGSCPNEEMLSDYIEGRLDREQKAGIEKHLSDCETCFQAFIISGSIVRGGDIPDLEPVPERVTRNAVNIIKNQCKNIPGSPVNSPFKLVSHFWSSLSTFLQGNSWGRYCLSRVRSSGKTAGNHFFRIRKSFDNLNVEIEIDRIGNSRANVKVFTVDRLLKKGIRVTLKTGDREISSQLIDNGYVVFEDLIFDHYKLVFSDNNDIYGTYSFKIK